MLPQPRRRWAFFPCSVISDYENPAAHLYRVMARIISSIDDEARFYEERGNPWLRNMLLRHGGDSFRQFQTRHPDVDYVTYEPRSGHRLAEWITLALATADIAVVDAAAPPNVVQWIGELTRPRLNTFLLDPAGDLSAPDAIPDYASYYSGFCTGSPNIEATNLTTVQRLISFGPASAGASQNGDPGSHIEASANELIQKLIRAVDDTLADRLDDSPPGASFNGHTF